MKVFVYNNASGELELNEPEILLVREFEGLWEKGRNKCKEDPTGTRRLRAFREFKYIFLMLDWLSPYSQFDEDTKNAYKMLVLLMKNGLTLLLELLVGNIESCRSRLKR